MNYNQNEFSIRLEWGLNGVEELAPISDVIIIVDVLSFSTCVDIATKNGALIFPYKWKDDSAIDYAKNFNAVLADSNRENSNGFSLSPTSLLNIESTTKLVLPSPNGSTLSLSTGKTPTLCGSLRNAESVAAFAKSYGNKISIIPAGEQWKDKSLRVAFEDLVGAGAIISYLKDDLSPESKAALKVFDNSKTTLFDDIRKCSSGKELTDRGFEKDILLASQLNSSHNVPVLNENHFVGIV